MARDALAGLLDQRTPFGRLALVHVLMTAGDTLLTVSLAGSLFFSISPEAAKGKVILYLVLTMAPFAVVAPMLGPVIDRSRGARRAMVVTSALCRAVMCLFMAGALKSLLLFPEAFTMLVLSKVYLVTKGSLVPQLASKAAGDQGQVDDDELATANARLGLLASLAGFAASAPAIAVLKLLGGPWVLRLDVVVFAAATVAGLRLPIRRARRSRPVAGAPASAAAAVGADAEWEDGGGPLAELGLRAGADPEVTLALSAMSVLKGLVGFLTFLLAFGLRRMHTATWWYGFVLGASMAGAVVGVLLVPRARRLLTEPQMLALSIWLVAVAAVVAGVVGGLLIQAVLAFVIGVAGASSKPAFDALVQRYIPVAAQGRAFASFETRLQLVW
ncbi:MAG: MFS transporter, partial [Acidimicrobiales bacterium]